MVEISQGAARVASPFSIDSLYQALLDLIENPTLKKSFIEKGLKHAEALTWKQTADTILHTLTGQNPER